MKSIRIIKEAVLELFAPMLSSGFEISVILAVVLFSMFAIRVLISKFLVNVGDEFIISRRPKLDSF